MKFMKIIPIKSIVVIFLGLFFVRSLLTNSRSIIEWFNSILVKQNMPIFSVSDLSDEQKQKLINVNAYNSKCPVPLEDLKILTISFKNFKNKTQVGEIIVHKKVANNVLNLFKDLFAAEFPLESVRPIYDFNGSDDLSMQANNTNAFHCRYVTYSNTVLSKHSYGTAIDFNPHQNPYFRRGVVLPSGSKAYLDRKIIKVGMVESIVHVLNRYGFKIWAGLWDSPKDYMHFEFVE